MVFLSLLGAKKEIQGTCKKFLLVVKEAIVSEQTPSSQKTCLQRRLWQNTKLCQTWHGDGRPQFRNKERVTIKVAPYSF
jgi:hypothetical protein